MVGRVWLLTCGVCIGARVRSGRRRGGVPGTGVRVGDGDGHHRRQQRAPALVAAEARPH